MKIKKLFIVFFIPLTLLCSCTNEPSSSLNNNSSSSEQGANNATFEALSMEVNLDKNLFIIFILQKT